MDVILQLLPAFLLVFIRLTGFFVTAPIFATKGVPNQFKIAFAFLLAVISFSYVPATQQIPLDLTFIMYVLKEALIGVILGFICELLFYTIQVAGGLMDMQMGFAMANVIDPRSGIHIPITGSFKNILATLYFLSINGHHLLIRGIISSYEAIPIDNVWVALGNEQVLNFFARVFANMFSSAFLLAAPIIVSLFLVDLSLGIIAKSVPQFNIFVVGLPIKMIVSFLLLFVVMPAFFVIMSSLFQKMFEAMSEMMKLLGGSS